MKNLFLTLIIFINTNAIAQMVVSAPAVETKLGLMQNEASSDNRKILEELKELNSTLKEKKAIQEEMRDREKRAEDALLIVPQYIKNGNEINSILDSEVTILKLIQQLKNAASNLQGINITSFINPILSAMEKDVNSAIQVCTDNVYRMSAEERRNYLIQINQRMSNKMNELTIKLREIESAIQNMEQDQKNKASFKRLMTRKQPLKN